MPKIGTFDGWSKKVKDASRLKRLTYRGRMILNKNGFKGFVMASHIGARVPLQTCQASNVFATRLMIMYPLSP